MLVSPESVSSNVPYGGNARVLVVSVSWLGDCIMAMPALTAFRRHLPNAHITVLAKPAVAPLWKLFPVIDEVIPLKKGFSGMRDTIRVVRKESFDFAYVLPKSFRSAWIPFIARVPGRRGMPGHGRDWMLTETVSLSNAAITGHQSLEMADVLHVAHGDLARPPFLVVPEPVRDQARQRLARPGGAESWIAFFPGAAYGPAKRWPADRFAELGRRLVAETRCGILVLGRLEDKPICDEVSAGIGGSAVNLAGQTDFLELAALLSLCRCVVANDSGGMHLAAGLDISVVGIFGITDPAKTAPVGVRSRVLCAEGARRSRDIDRKSPEACAAIASIPLDTVLKSVLSTVS